MRRLALTVVLALVATGCGDGEAPSAGSAPVASAPPSSGSAPSRGTSPKAAPLRWSKAALQQADAVLAAVRGERHAEAVRILYPEAPSAPAPNRARVVLVGGPAGPVDDTLTVLDRTPSGTWAAQASAVQERVDQSTTRDWNGRTLAVDPAALDRALETARILLGARFERTATGGEGRRSSGPDGNLFAVRIEVDGTVDYDRCPATETLVDGVRANRAVIHQALFRLFSDLADEAKVTNGFDADRWGAWVDTALAGVTPREATGRRSGRGRIAHALVRHAAWSGGPKAADQLTRLGQNEAAKRAALRSAFDPDWAEQFLRNRYAHDREDRKLVPAVRDAFHRQEPARYRAFLAAELASVADDDGARAEVAGELARRYGAAARDDLAPALADDDLNVRAAAALGLLEASPDDVDGRAALEGIARAPELAVAAWRGFEESPRHRVLARLIDDASLWSTTRLAEQLEVAGEDPRILSLVLAQLDERGQTVGPEDQVTLFRRALTEPVHCGTLHAVERLVALDDRASLKAMKETLAALGRWRSPIGWSPIDTSAFLNEKARIEQAFWDWVAARPAR